MDIEKPQIKEVNTFIPSNGENHSPLSIYLNEIGSYPMLLTSEEKRYGKALLAGRIAASRLNSGEELAYKERSLLANKIKLAKEAEIALINANYRLVIPIAAKYANGDYNRIIDYIQEGNIGLIIAVGKYDYRIAKFDTFATYYIRACISLKNLIDQENSRIPANSARTHRKIKKISGRFYVRNGENPTPDELLEMGMTKKDIATYRLIQRITRDFISLDQSYYSDNETWHDHIPSDLPEVHFNVEFTLLDQSLRKILNEIPVKEAWIIRLHFGIDQTTNISFEEIGKKMKMTGENARLIFLKGMKRLRHIRRMRILRLAMGDSYLFEV